MAEYLVRMTWEEPDIDALARADLLRQERDRALELVDAGLIKRMWRVPGQRANLGLWSSADPTDLHEALISFPYSPYFSADVEALAEHPLEQYLRKIGTPLV